MLPAYFLDQVFKPKISRETVEQYNKLLREKLIPLKDTGTNSRVFNLWKKVGLVNVPLNREHIKLSFTEFIWVKIIQDLRKFGCSLEDIENAKKLCDQRDIAELEKESAEAEKLLTGLRNYMTHRSKEERQGLMLHNYGQLIEQLELDALGQPLNNLETFLLYMLTTKSSPYILFFVNQNLQEPETETSDEKSKGAKMLLPYFYDDAIGDSETSVQINELPHLRIPLKHYVKDFISDENNAKHLEKIELLSKDELALLTQIREGNATEITVKFKDGKPDRMEVTQNIKKEVEARIIETFTSHEYADVSYKVADGNMITFQKTTKIKLSDK